MKPMNQTKFVIALCLLVIASSVAALSPPEPEFNGTFGQSFSMIAGQTAKFSENTNSLFVRAESMIGNTCSDVNSDSNMQVCALLMPGATVVVSGCTTQSDLVGCSAPEKIHVIQGEPVWFMVMGNKYSILLQDVTQSTIPSLDTNMVQRSWMGTFVVKKESSQPDHIIVKLGEQFSLVPYQTAAVQKNSSTLTKVTLHRILIATPMCTPGTPCTAFRSVSGTASLPNGTATDFSLSDGEKMAIGEKLILRVAAIADTKAAFVVTEQSQNNQIVVSLGKDFDLKQKQTGIVRETGFEIEFMDYWQNKMLCPEPNDVRCLPVARFRVRNILKATTGSANSITGQVTGNSAIATDTQVIERRIAMPLVELPNPFIELRQGESKTIWGHTVTLNKLATERCVSDENATLCEVTQEAMANLRITQSSVPADIRVGFNEKFSLKEGQTALVTDPWGKSVTAKEAYKPAPMPPQTTAQVRVTLNSVDFIACAYVEGIKCDDRPVTSLTIQPFTQSHATIVKVREGESTRVGDYQVSVLDVPTDSEAVLLVEKIANDTRRVSLDEKFELLPRQTVLVDGPDMYITMEELVTMESYPEQYVAVLRVYKKLYYAQSTSTKTSPEEAVSSTIRPQVASYKIKPGESLSLYGATITFLHSDGKSGSFVVSQPENPGIINVHVEDPFTLETNQIAQVLEANLRIELLGTSVTPCFAVDAVDSEEPNLTRPCLSRMVARISVSNFIGTKYEAGKKVASESVTSTIVSSESEATMPTQLIPSPLPTTSVYELQEGQEITVNDFTIKAQSIGDGKMELVVRGKPMYNELKFEIASGWNLFSLPGDITAEKNDCQTSEWKVFEYDRETGKFVRVQAPLAGRAYWIHNPGVKCTVAATLRNPVPLSQLDTLMPKWNFVPVTVEMVGKKIQDLGDCQIKAVFWYNPESRKWQRVESTISKSGLGKGFAVYSENKCRLDNGTNDDSPPGFPDLEDEPSESVWLSIQPIQCQENAWEKWHASLNRQYIRQPTEKEIVSEWLEVVHGIKWLSFEAVAADPGTTTCSACDCPRGDTIKIKVAASNAVTLEKLGFTVVSK